MNLRVRKGKIMGSCRAPASKSISHRAVICASLADGGSIVSNCLSSNDLEATVNACKALGARIEVRGGKVGVVGETVLRAPAWPINCNESGTTIRLMAPIAALAEGVTVLTGTEGLMRRPMAPIIGALGQLGVECANGKQGIRVRGGGLDGGRVKVQGDVSSQFISGLLLALPLAGKDSEILVTTEVESKPYIALTLEVMKAFGVRVEVSADMKSYKIPGAQQYIARELAVEGGEFVVEGDYSSAAFMLAAGVLAGEVKVEGLRGESVQGDAAIIGILKRMGAKIKVQDEGESDSINVEKSKLKGIEIDVKDTPDLVPILAVLATQAKGETRIVNAGRLRVKESDRLAAISSELRNMGAEIKELADGLVVKGQTRLNGCEVNPHGDHRIAMACAVAGLVAEGETVICDAGCVAKSYPSFFEDLKALGGKVGVV